MAQTNDRARTVPSPRTLLPVRRPWFVLLLLWVLAVGVIVGAAVVAVTAVRFGLDAMDLAAPPDRRWSRLSVIAIVAVPILCFVFGALLTRGSPSLTFQAQQTNNRRASGLLIVALVGLYVAIVTTITASLTFDAQAALTSATVAALLGVGAAYAANRWGAALVMRAASGRPADPTKDAVLLDVVRELSIAANVPMPQVFVVEDPALNAFAVGRDPANASLAATRGLLDTMDREQLQGVIGHELSHVRNLDSRYGMYLAVLVGLVVLITDAFLRGVLEAWKQGAFFVGGDDSDGIKAMIAGVAFGLFLTAVAALLWFLAPIGARLVQAAASRERELLADATAVEITRNPAGLERALARIEEGSTVLRHPNRGSQHLWFGDPTGESTGTSLFATHPALEERIARLRTLRGLG